MHAAVCSAFCCVVCLGIKSFDDHARTQKERKTTRDTLHTYNYTHKITYVQTYILYIRTYVRKYTYTYTHADAYTFIAYTRA